MVLQARLEFFIHQSVVLSMAVYLTTMSEGLSTGIPAKHPIRFNIESQKHGSLLKGKDRISQNFNLKVYFIT